MTWRASTLRDAAREHCRTADGIEQRMPGSKWQLLAAATGDLADAIARDLESLADYLTDRLGDR